MKEKFSSIDKVYGKELSEEGKEDILQEYHKRFTNQQFEKLLGKEREKTKEELEIIALANEKTNALRRTYGLEDFTIPEKNIHIIPADHWPEDARDSDGFFDYRVQAVALKDHDSHMAFAGRAFHELLHFKSFGSLEERMHTIESADETKILKTLIVRRSGLNAAQRKKEQFYFNNLDEAVVETLTIRLMEKSKTHSLFKNELQQTENLKAHKYEDSHFVTRDTFYMWLEEGEKTHSVFKVDYSYKRERAMLDNLMSKLHARNVGKVWSKDEVFDMFAKAMFTGNILPIGKLIDNTFGKGTFRTIGEYDEDIKKQEKYIASL